MLTKVAGRGSSDCFPPALPGDSLKNKSLHRISHLFPEGLRQSLTNLEMYQDWKQPNLLSI